VIEAALSEGVPIEDWVIETAYLQQLRATHRVRERANYRNILGLDTPANLGDLFHYERLRCDYPLLPGM
jgi:hypothetical protein